MLKGKLKGDEHGFEHDLPMHSEQPMHQEGDQLVSWQIALYSAQSIPENHGKIMELIE